MNKAIAGLTDCHIGQAVSVIIRGDVMMRPVIQTALPGAEFTMTTPVPADVLLLAERLPTLGRAAALCG